MLLSVVAWDDNQHRCAETKVRTALYLRGVKTVTAGGRLDVFPESPIERAVAATNWMLAHYDEEKNTPQEFRFTTLMPAYALADAAETCEDARGRRKRGDTRLISLQALWEHACMIDAAVVVTRGEGDDTLLDAAHDLARHVTVVSVRDIWDASFGDGVADQLLKAAGFALHVDSLNGTKVAQYLGKKRSKRC